MNTRRAFIASSLATFSGCGLQAHRRDFVDVSAALAELQPFRYGLIVRQINPADSLTINADTPLAAASILKLLIAIAVIRQESMPLNRRIFLPTGAFIASSANLLKPGSAVPIYPLLELMIEQSDNVAANTLLLQTGLSAVRKTGAQLGLNATEIHGLFRDANPGLRHGSTSACDVGKMLLWLMRSTAGAPRELQQRSLQVLTLMTKQRDRRLIESGLPTGLVTANKTGETDSVLNDASIIDPFGPNPIVAVVLCSGVSDKGRAVKGFRKVGYGIFDYLYPSLLSR